MSAQTGTLQGTIAAADAAGIARAVVALKAGKLVGLPTETVYGVGADAGNGAAVAKIYAAKGRPRFNPLIAHVSNLAAARELGGFNGIAEKLAQHVWPGPLTLVVPYHGGNKISDLARAGLDTIALRVPSHPVMHAVLSEFGKPIVAPSANRSGHVSATSAQHVQDDLGAALDVILDGGSTALGLESTILDCTSEKPLLLRQGALARDVLEKLLGFSLHAKTDHDPAKPSAPGQLSAHYAPRAPVRLNAEAIDNDEALLAFGKPLTGARHMLNLSEKADLVEAAANLFAHLRALDGFSPYAIAVMPIPEKGLGEAINDRLRRAALGRK